MHKNKGMITIETLLCLPLFLIFLAAIIFMMDAIMVQARIQGAVDEAAKEISVFSYIASKESREYSVADINENNQYISQFLDGGTSVDCSEVIAITSDTSFFRYKLKSLVARYLGTEYGYGGLERMGVVDGIDGLNFEGSSYNLYGDGTLVIKCTYYSDLSKFPILNILPFKKKMTVTATTRIWKE